MLHENEIRKYNNETKQYWNVDNFNNQILNWRFSKPIIQSEYVIGHPTNSHKGSSVGDILPYTRLPGIIKSKFPNSIVKVPEWFWTFFKDNPNVDGISNNLQRWGSLGTWGTTVQRTCNVWGFHTYDFAPIVYSSRINKDAILICTMSKTGGKVQDISKFEDIVDELKSKYYCVQLATSQDTLLKNVNEYVFNVSINNIISFISQFKIYIGAQNSIYHLSKALGLDVVGILPENIDPYYVMLPFFTQINHLEIEMLSNQDKYRSHVWKDKIAKLGKNPNDSHHCGWLYPDTPHLTMNFDNSTNRCPSATPNNILLALDNLIYPFNDSRLWDVDIHRSYWI